MATEIKVPALGESVTTATIARWMKQPGDTVAADEPLVELETDKVTVEVSAPVRGVLTAINYPEGSEVEVGALLGILDGEAAAPWRPETAAACAAAGGPARRPPPAAAMAAAQRRARRPGRSPDRRPPVPGRAARTRRRDQSRRGRPGHAARRPLRGHVGRARGRPP